MLGSNVDMCEFGRLTSEMVMCIQIYMTLSSPIEADVYTLFGVVDVDQVEAWVYYM